MTTEGFSWQRDDSIPRKRELIELGWGSKVPDYLFYDIGGIVRLTQAEVEEIKATFFPGKEPGFGDIELHPSQLIPGTVYLRIRDATAYPMHITIRGRACHLFQFGHADDKGTPKIGNFHELWETADNKAVN